MSTIKVTGMSVVGLMIFLLAVATYLFSDSLSPGNSSNIVKAGKSGKSSEINFKWRKDRGTRIHGSVPYAYSLKRDSGKIRLYFCGLGPGIGSATSNNGLKFNLEPGTRLSSSDEYGNQPAAVCDASLVKLPNGRMRMYYKAAQGQGGPGQATHKVYSAVSSDGINFTKEGLRIDSDKTGDNGWASVPEAIKLRDGRVRIYYVSGDFAARGGTMSAVSRDGLIFKKEGGARVKQMVDPAVIELRKGLYLMLAVVLPAPPNSPVKSKVKTGIYSFTSSDGKRFGNRHTVITDKGVYDPSIVKVGRDKYRIFYGKDLGSPEKPNIVTKSLTGRVQK